MWWVLSALLWAVYAAALWTTGFQAVGLLAALWWRRRPPPHVPPMRLRVLIPAHNEERVIAACVRSLRRCEYPQELVDVWVVADRCTDSTPALARAAGANVLCRPAGPVGKGAVLRYALERLGHHDVDGIVVLDADNVVNPGFLRDVVHGLQRHGYVQATVDVRGRLTPVSAAYRAVAYLTHLYQLGRHVLGYPVLLSGTGFAVRSDVLARVPMDCETLVEDLEYSWALAAAGVRGAYLPAARVYDEKPCRLGDSFRQRLRWARGGWQLAAKVMRDCRRYNPLLLWDLASQCLLRAFPLVWCWAVVAGGLPYLFRYTAFATIQVAVAALVGGWGLRSVLHGAAMPLLVATEAPITIWSLVTWRNRNWVRTPHMG